MARVNETERQVKIGGETMFRQDLASRGVIPSLDWEEGQQIGAFVQKTTIKKDRSGYHEGVLPSWVFFEEITGLKPNIMVQGIQGDFEYDPLKSAEKNIEKVIAEKGIRQITESELFRAEDKLKLIEIVNSVEVPEGLDKEDVKVDLTEETKEFFDKALSNAKRDFIKERTEIRIITGKVVSTKVDKFRQGTIPTYEQDEEAYKYITKLSNLVYNMDVAAFEKKMKSDPTTEHVVLSRDSDDYRNKFSAFRFNNSPMNRPRDNSAIFMEAGQVVLLDDEWKQIAGKNSSNKTQMSYFLVNSEDRFKKFANRRFAEPGVDTELDYISYRLEFNQGDNKMQAANKMGVQKFELRIPEDEVYETFREVLPTESYKKCWIFQEYPPKEIASTISQWVADNKSLLEDMTAEDLEKSQELINELGLEDGMGIDDVEDVLGDISEEIEESASKDSEESSEIDSIDIGDALDGLDLGDEGEEFEGIDLDGLA